MKRRSFLRGLLSAPLAPVAAQAIKILPRPRVKALDLVEWGKILKAYYKPQFISASIYSASPFAKFLKKDSGIATPTPAVSLDA